MTLFLFFCKGTFFFSIYVIFRVPGVRDVMYEAKKPSSIIRLLPLDEEISSEESLLHILRTSTFPPFFHLLGTYKTRLVTWDLKNRLMRHEDEYFELMRKLESEYSSVRLETMDEHFMDAKLSLINNLVVANSLAYDGLVSRKCTRLMGLAKPSWELELALGNQSKRCRNQANALLEISEKILCTQFKYCLFIHPFIIPSKSH